MDAVAVGHGAAKAQWAGVHVANSPHPFDHQKAPDTMQLFN